MAQVHAEERRQRDRGAGRAAHDTASYGIVSAEKVSPGLSKMSAIVEKPKPEDAPSTLGVVGRYILSRASSTSSRTCAPARAARSSSPTPSAACCARKR
jgi:dTDP-glucose pyrophosphorylase